MANYYGIITDSAQDVQQPERKELSVMGEEIPRKSSKWQQLVDIINFIGTVVSLFIHPPGELDRFHRSIKGL